MSGMFLGLVGGLGRVLRDRQIVLLTFCTRCTAQIILTLLNECLLKDVFRTSAKKLQAELEHVASGIWQFKYPLLGFESIITRKQRKNSIVLKSEVIVISLNRDVLRLLGDSIFIEGTNLQCARSLGSPVSKKSVKVLSHADRIAWKIFEARLWKRRAFSAFYVPPRISCYLFAYFLS